MSKKELFMMLSVIMACLASCYSFANETGGDPLNTKYNICLVLDGTDRLSTQNGVPQISADEIVEFARNLSEKGGGCLYVTYIDKDVDNNAIAYFEWLEDAPRSLGAKPGYMKVSEYQRLKAENEAKQDAYRANLAKAIDAFSSESAAIVKAAYSDAVAKEKRGSDVTGAVNQASHLLRSSDVSGKSYIVLVSDGCDNVGKELAPISPNTKLIIVSSNVAKHPFGDIVLKEYVNFRQVKSFFFK